jgi:type I restriction enzyme S subunit
VLSQQKYRLEQCLDRIVDNRGRTPPLSDVGIEMIEINALEDGRKSPNYERVSKFVTEETFLNWFRSGHPKRGDTLISTVGAIGRVAYFHEERGCIAQNVIALRPKQEVLVPEFLYYYLASSDIQTRLANLNIGVAQPSLKVPHLLSLEISLPPLPIQTRIVGILSAYDDLIENNQRRIRILEEMARSLYREWFVNFRFPGHEKVPLVNSPLGKIPEGWDVKKLKDVANVNRAQIKADTAPEQLHYIDISSVSPGQIDAITTYNYAEAPGRARRVVQHGDILWSCVRPNRRSHVLVLHPALDTIASTGFAVLTASKVPFTFLYLATTTDDFVSYLANRATGAAYPAVTAVTFESADLLVPTERLLHVFGDVTVPIAEEVNLLQQQTTNLRRSRDLLLPQLLSGAVMFDDVQLEATPVDSPGHPFHGPSQNSNRSSVRALNGDGDRITVPAATAGSNPAVAANGSDRREETPPPISETERTDVLAAIRQVFSDGEWRDRESAIREVAHALGYSRTGHVIEEVLNTDLLTAVRRGILENVRGELKLRTRSIEDYERDFLKEQFLAAIGRTWIEREDAIREFARWLGFARTGSVIDEIARSLIKGLLREERIETDGPNLIRRL